MPIPLLFIAAGAAICKGIVDDQQEASDTNRIAGNIVEASKKEAKKSRENCEKAISDLGKRKINVLNWSVVPFINQFEKINHIELSEIRALDKLQGIDTNEMSISDLKELQSMAATLAEGLASGAMAGAIVAFGAYGVAETIATASAGTAIIASLGGTAAANATLAFLGGSLTASGIGMGMAGAFGGLVAGPALAVLGAVVGSKASENLENAKANMAKAKKFREEMETASTLCNGIRKRSAMFDRFLLRLQTVFDPLVYRMSEIIEEKGADYRKFSDEEKQVVASAMSLAGAIKAILDTAILDKEGNLTEESGVIIGETKKKIETIIA